MRAASQKDGKHQPHGHVNAAVVSIGITNSFGTRFARRRRNVLNVDRIVGNYEFQPTLTSNCAGSTTTCSVNSSTGVLIRILCIGLSDPGQAGVDEGIVGERRPEYSAYVQDDFRVSRKLPVNLGLRYDLTSDAAFKCSALFRSVPPIFALWWVCF